MLSICIKIELKSVSRGVWIAFTWCDILALVDIAVL